MKKFAFLALFLSLGLFTVGCKPTEKKTTPPVTGVDSSSKPADMPVETPVEKPAEEPK